MPTDHPDSSETTESVSDRFPAALDAAQHTSNSELAMRLTRTYAISGARGVMPARPSRGCRKTGGRST